MLVKRVSKKYEQGDELVHVGMTIHSSYLPTNKL